MDEHSLQSPFVFKLYTEALVKPKSGTYHQDVEDLRREYLGGNRSLPAGGFGAGSNLAKSNDLSQIARYGISDRRQSEILSRLIEWSSCASILELGTSLGINTAYMARCEGVNRVVTIEGNEQLAREAQINFSRLGLDSIIQLINSDADAYLDRREERYDLIYIDANHTYEATVRYFHRSLELLNPNGILVIDDINWSKEMLQAWEAIKNHNKNTITLENDKIGIVFMGKQSAEDSYILRF